MPSKTTVIQLNRRVYSNTVACADHLSADALRQCCGTNTISTKNTPAIEVKLSWRRRKPNRRPSLLCMYLMCDVVPVKGGDIPSARFVLFVRVYTFVHPRDRPRLRQSVNSTTTEKTKKKRWWISKKWLSISSRPSLCTDTGRSNVGRSKHVKSKGYLYSWLVFCWKPRRTNRTKKIAQCKSTKVSLDFALHTSLALFPCDCFQCVTPV